ncbi:hypothetical protein TSACC_22699 [Terrimicrobium sacchariphilum]|uniref:Uncharacterized protein n=1 Tax=Terrimicrobium sacchariphilum TaxID=690879 RepID=A0A146GBU0_TERSA|nr:hypothetical protein [Terrimicrobium sacchariphilum]GAT34274.1 hypothetical protein TSACC_22699 [Terrimicrobium sacchariphilum]
MNASFDIMPEGMNKNTDHSPCSAPNGPLPASTKPEKERHQAPPAKEPRKPRHGKRRNPYIDWPGCF